MSIEEMELFEAECKLLCYKGNMSRSNLGSFYNNRQTNWMYQMWLSSKNREGYKLVPVNYECVWCGCTELDGWTNEAMIGACDDH